MGFRKWHLLVKARCDLLEDMLRCFFHENACPSPDLGYYDLEGDGNYVRSISLLWWRPGASKQEWMRLANFEIRPCTSETCSELFATAYHTNSIPIIEYIVSQVERWQKQPLAAETAQQVISHNPAGPWECIQDERDREIVRLWTENYTAEEVGSSLQVSLSAGTVLNIITKLRKQYGREVVPFH